MDKVVARGPSLPRGTNVKIVARISKETFDVPAELKVDLSYVIRPGSRQRRLSTYWVASSGGPR